MNFSFTKIIKKLSTLFLVFFLSMQVSYAAFFTSEDHAGTSSTFSFSSTIRQKLVNYVQKTVSTLRYSYYKFGGNEFDEKRGVYIVDCSSYVDNVLQNIYPNAYSSLVYSTGTEKPTTEHYYNFINRLSDANNYWDKVDNVKQLQPGDILVFRNMKGLRRTSGGHIMVVMDKPVFGSNSYLVRVADSAPSGHSADTRSTEYSGIGIGTLLIKANPRTGKPLAYAWKEGALWKRNVKIAMARPIDVN